MAAINDSEKVESILELVLQYQYLLMKIHSMPLGSIA
jgi:hypothetical protein